MDEMKIKSGLVFNKRLGKLIGFETNQDLQTLESNLCSNEPSKQPVLADSMLVLIVRPVL